MAVMYKCVITQTLSAVMAWFSFYRHVCNQCHQASVILSVPRVSLQHMFARFKYREADFQTVFSQRITQSLVLLRLCTSYSCGWRHGCFQVFRSVRLTVCLCIREATFKATYYFTLEEVDLLHSNQKEEI